MRKLILLASVIALSACAKVDHAEGSADSNTPPGKLKIISREQYGAAILVDTETGCEFYNSYRGGMLPRYNSDGKTIKGCKNGS